MKLLFASVMLILTHQVFAAEWYLVSIKKDEGRVYNFVDSESIVRKGRFVTAWVAFGLAKPSPEGEALMMLRLRLDCVQRRALPLTVVSMSKAGRVVNSTKNGDNVEHSIIPGTSFDDFRKVVCDKKWPSNVTDETALSLNEVDPISAIEVYEKEFEKQK